MHVGFSVVTVKPGQIGGAETYLRGLLASLPDREEITRITVLGNPETVAAYGPELPASAGSALVHGLTVSGSAPQRAASMIKARVLRERAVRGVPDGLDLVHYPVAVKLPVIAAPSVVTLHDVQHLDMPEHFSAANRLYRRLAYDNLTKAADGVITDSDHARARIIEHLDIDPARVWSIPLGIDHARFTPAATDEDAALLAPHGLPDRFLYYPANAWPHKNHEMAFQALARLQDKEIPLVLTGQVYDRGPQLEEAAAAAGVTARVMHLGYVSRSTVAALHRRATALVFPSLYEGFGIPPLEAMACGTAVVCSNVASLPEVCGDAALTIDPRSPASIADAVDRVLGDDAIRTDLVERGLAQAARFSWDAAAAEHVRVYRSVLDATR